MPKLPDVSKLSLPATTPGASTFQVALPPQVLAVADNRIESAPEKKRIELSLVLNLAVEPMPTFVNVLVVIELLVMVVATPALVTITSAAALFVTRPKGTLVNPPDPTMFRLVNPEPLPVKVPVKMLAELVRETGPSTMEITP